MKYILVSTDCSFLHPPGPGAKVEDCEDGIDQLHNIVSLMLEGAHIDVCMRDTTPARMHDTCTLLKSLVENISLLAAKDNYS